MARQSRAVYLRSAGATEKEALATIASGENPDGSDFELTVAGGVGGGGDLSFDGTDVTSANPLPVQQAGVTSAPTTATGQVATSTSAGTLLAARSTRHRVTFLNTHASITVYIGPATVTAGNGFPLIAGAAVTLYTRDLIQAIAASGTPTVAYVEAYG